MRRLTQESTSRSPKPSIGREFLVASKKWLDLHTRVKVDPVVPDYSYPLECLTFAPLTCTLISDLFCSFLGLIP